MERIFRGKTLTGRWVEGSYYKQEEFYGSKEDADVIITSKESLTYDQALDYAIVIPETVGQYTGLTDKNGKKIFEGDIVKNEFGEIDKVAFLFGRFVPFNRYPEYRCFFCERCEVIGNIHDNPELLEVK